jgi:hypothetical protein
MQVLKIGYTKYGNLAIEPLIIMCAKLFPTVVRLPIWETASKCGIFGFQSFAK